MNKVFPKLTVLYLEDSEIDVEIVCQKLKDEFRCSVIMDSAATESCFLEFIKNKKYDVILADYTLPGYNAISALEQAQRICPDTPFICVSGTIGEDLAVEMLKQGATDYVIKDRLERLPFAIRRAIESSLLEQDRKLAEQKVKELSESNRLILESTIEGIGMLDRDGNILNINENFAQRLGYAVADVIGMNLKTFLPEEIYGDMYQQRLERLRNTFDSGQPEIFEDSRNDRCFYNRYYPVFKDGQVSAVALFSTDITDRKKAEEEARKIAVLEKETETLRQKEAEYIQILDGSAETTWIFDFQTGILEYSPAWRVRIGGENIPDADMNLFTKSLIHPDDLDRIILERKSIVENQHQKYKYEYRLKLAGGEYIWVLDQGKIIYDSSGKPAKVYGTTRDISDRKIAEEALRESEHKALALVAELEEADKNKNQFISVLSHELRNPLAAISAGIQVLDISNNIDQVAKVKEIINRQINQLCKLVDDLLDLTRITQNKIKLKKEHFNLNEIVKNAVEDIRFEYEKKGVKLGTKIQTTPVLLNVDPVRITQAVGNILYNSLKFSQENGTVWLTLKTKKDFAVISIKDNGIGINPEILSQLFKPFTQADNTLARSGGGLGLGLSIVKGIVDLHGGKLSAHSEGLGRGAEFTISLPLYAQKSEGSQNEEKLDNMPHALKVLIIEDNKDLADILRSMLGIMGHKAITAYDGLEGLEKAKEFIPDIIFCDIGLPGICGYEVAKKVRADYVLKNVFLVALTGYAGANDIKQAIQNGFNRHLAKPVDMAALKQILYEVP